MAKVPGLIHLQKTQTDKDKNRPPRYPGGR